MRQRSNLFVLQVAGQNTVGHKITSQEENKIGNNIDIFGMTIPT